MIFYRFPGDNVFAWHQISVTGNSIPRDEVVRHIRKEHSIPAQYDIILSHRERRPKMLDLNVITKIKDFTMIEVTLSGNNGMKLKPVVDVLTTRPILPDIPEPSDDLWWFESGDEYESYGEHLLRELLL